MSRDLARAWRRFWAKPPAERRTIARRLLVQLRRGGPRAVLSAIRANSVPADERSRYLAWCDRHTPMADELERMRAESSRFVFQPLISIITPVFNTDSRWLHECAASVRAQAYPRWEWCIGNDGSTREDTLTAVSEIAKSDTRIRVLHAPRNGGISAATNLALSGATGDYVALMDSDDALLPHALYRMVEYLNRPGPRADVIYSDEDKLDVNGERCDAYFKPDWSPDLFLSQMFVCHLLMARRELVLQVGGFRSEYDYSQDYDLMLRLMEKAERILHVPDILYHWRKLPDSGASVSDAKPAAHYAAQRAIQDYLARNGINGRVEDAGPPGLHRVRYAVTGQPAVSIVMPTKGRTSERLAQTLAAIDSKTTYSNLEIVLVTEDEALGAQAAAILARRPHRIVRATGAFNFSARVNRGAASAQGRHLLVLHDDVEPLDAGWLDALVELSEQRAIGVVGAKLFYPHGALQHIGLVLGLHGFAGRPFQGFAPETAGYFSSANCIRNCSAVSGACLMTRRDVFDAVAGFDEAYDVHGGDIDYGLKVWEAGYRVVFTPYARLTHHESGRLGEQMVPETTIARLRARWGSRFENDPFYNPHLTREALDYRVRVQH